MVRFYFRKIILEGGGGLVGKKVEARRGFLVGDRAFCFV